jgi:hypothetical protein
VLDLERELQELRCKENILKDILERYNGHLSKLGDRELPAGVDLLDNAASAPNYERVGIIWSVELSLSRRALRGDVLSVCCTALAG